MMQRLAAIYRKELKSHFQSVTAYVTIGIFFIITGYFFVNIFKFYNLLSLQSARDPSIAESLNIIERVMRPLFSNISIVLLLVLPLLTMRLIAEERKQGTFELLLTYPVRDIETVGGKFLATLTTFAVMLAGTLLFPLLLSIFADPEPGPIITGYLGLFLMGCMFISIGIFFSSLTNHQLVAGISTFGVALLFLVIGWASPFVSPAASKVLLQFSLLKHFESFAKGVLDTQDITYYLFTTFFFLFMTLKSIESNRWRS